MMQDNNLFNEHHLALELKMTVGELRQTMTHKEYLGWQSYFRRREAERPKN